MIPGGHERTRSFCTFTPRAGFEVDPFRGHLTEPQNDCAVALVEQVDDVDGPVSLVNACKAPSRSHRAVRPLYAGRNGSA